MEKIELLENKRYKELIEYMEENKDFYIGDDTIITYGVKNLSNDEVRLMLEAGVYINHCDKQYQSAIMYAAIADDLEMLELLVEFKGLTRLKNTENQTALDLAIIGNSFKVSRYLLALYDEFTADESKALEILSQKGNQFKNAMHLIKTSSYEWVKVYKGNVIIKLEEYFFLYWDETIPFDDLYQAIGEEAKTFFICDRNIYDAFGARSEFVWTAECDHYHLDNISKLSEVEYDIDSLTVEDVDYIYNNFDEIYDYDREYVKIQVQVSPTSAVRQDGKLVAWAFCHDDGSLGGLYVIESLRKHGLAKQISSSIIKRVFDKLQGVYVDIKKDNVASQNLSKGMGFEVVRENFWFEVK